MNKTSTLPSVLCKTPQGRFRQAACIFGLLISLCTGWVVQVQAQTPTTPAATQTRVITGTITDAEGSALVGVTVVAKTSKKSTLTDAKGQFSLRVTDADRIVVLSFIGMETYEAKIQNTSIINVALKESSNQLQDVVVNGYYKTDKNTFTGAATTITAKDIESISQTNIFSVLQAVDPSFRVIEDNVSGGDPNRTLQIQVRGGSSLNNQVRNQFTGDPNMPTFIVDGFEMTPEKVFDLDPTRIESIVLLKDASATAMYGSRAANGVVVVELKKPQPGKLNVQYNLQAIVTAADLSDYHLTNAAQKIDVEKAAGLIVPLDDLDNTHIKNMHKGYDTYWLSKPLQRGYSLAHSLNIGGGNENFSYGFTVSTNPSRGVMIGSDRRRHSLGNTLTYRTKKINITNTLNFDNVVGNNSPYGGFSQYAKLNPYHRPTDDNGQYILKFWGNHYNPLWNTTLRNLDQTRYSLYTNSLGLIWFILPNLTFNGGGAINIRNGADEEFLSSQHTSFDDPESSTTFTQRGSYKTINTKEIRWETRGTLTFTQTFRNQHTVSSNVGFRYNSVRTIQNGFKAIGFVTDDLFDPSFANSYALEKPIGNSRITKDGSVFGNLNYSFANRYFADITYSRDASSLFGKNTRLSNNFSAGIGYNLHKSLFVEKLKHISLFRLRAAFGQVGGQGFDPTNALYIYNFYTADYYNSYAVGATLTSLGNEELKWQRKINLNLGADIGFFHNRITTSINYYNALTKDAVIPITIAPSLGFSTYTGNLGQLRNTGVEFNFSAALIKKQDIQLSVRGNGSYNRNILLKLSDALKAINDQQDAELNATTPTSVSPRFRYIEGQSQNMIWVVRSLGIDPASGNEIFLNKNNEKTFIWSAADQVPYASKDPDLNGTLSLQFRYKMFELNTIMGYSLGGMTYNTTLVDRVENADLRFNVDERVFSQRWRQPGDNAFFKSITDKTRTKPTSRFVQRNNFLEMTSINVSYMVPSQLTKRLLHMQSLKFTFYMQDVFRASTIEMERGLSYPFAQTFNLATRVTF